jgi:hypothetical protein
MPTRLISRTRSAYILVAIVWAITRIYPLSQAKPWTNWEVAEAKKLLQYGFSERHGAIIDFHFMTGVVSEPWKHNYVNHPYPILWLDTFVYRLAGPCGVLFLSSVLGLFACLAVVPALRCCSFSQRQCLIGSLLYTLAPCGILFDADTNIVAMGAIIWPISIYLIGQEFAQKRLIFAALLGLAVFAGGQVSWFTYTAFPVLLGLAAGLCYDKARGITLAPNAKLLTAATAGTALSLAVFALQIWAYTYNFADTLSYLHGQASAEHGIPILRMYLAIALRSILSVGPALILGAMVGLLILARARSINRFQMASALYPLCFGIAALGLPRFFFRERTMYGYLVFPCTVLTLSALVYVKNRVVAAGVLCLAVVSLAYPMLQASIPKVSETSKRLGDYIRTISSPEDVVATNLRHQDWPFQPWDVGSITNTCLVADRVIREDISTKESLQESLTNFQTNQLNVVFLCDASKPIDDSLHTFLEGLPGVVKTRFVIPVEPPRGAIRLRNIYWRVVGKHQTSTEVSKKNIEDFSVFHFRLSLDDGLTKPLP